ncbi:DUF6517 family protein [Haloglomus litoreum]|uniref:DUF6517 family protein n=1 Tax=Haloglomus litoreum TaxID=3034026 RepID=UPI0023E81566|nr:DUF6517 family protein [Haloglomus sp. DT116]
MVANDTEESGPVARLGRRRLLATLGTATAVSLAGCGGVTSQSFESSPTGLSATAQEELRLGEESRESPTVERSAAGGNVSVSVTSHTAVYSRAAGLGGQ